MTPVVIWNPLVALSNVAGQVLNGRRRVLFDLLDDWTVHYAFRSIRPPVESAYKRLFSAASVVVANSEGTLALAKRFGRNDALLMPNGCDPDRFSTQSCATGRITVGYIGKIGHRVDLELIEKIARELPGVDFVFAGPILDRIYRTRLTQIPNVRLEGDVHYAAIPKLLSTFDIGWVPHSVGKMEVGGDAMKIYEYRAAGLPVLTTPIIGAGARNLSSVYVEDRDSHAEWLRRRTQSVTRVEREAGTIPLDCTWEQKARTLLELFE